MKKRDRRKRGFGVIKRRGAAAAAVLILLAPAAYFGNLILFQNRETVLSAVVLRPVEDTEILEEVLAGIVKPEEGERILIQSVDGSEEVNLPVVITWIRARSADVVIGGEDEIRELGERGCLAELAPDGAEACFGRETGELPGVPLDRPLIGTAVNAEHEEAALLVIETLAGKSDGE